MDKLFWVCYQKNTVLKNEVSKNVSSIKKNVYGYKEVYLPGNPVRGGYYG